MNAMTITLRLGSGRRKTVDVSTIFTDSKEQLPSRVKMLDKLRLAEGKYLLPDTANMREILLRLEQKNILHSTLWGASRYPVSTCKKPE